jgi:16S rRNA (adenine1518-N6/adenine1519-N6)-dimethyltransferase
MGEGVHRQRWCKLKKGVEHKPKKRFGQNFLKDRFYLEKIVQAIPDGETPIVEIGSGLGDLTEKLLEKRGVVVGYEIDRDLCQILKEKFPTLQLKCGDALEIWQREGSLWSGEYDIVANLPYYIATKLILMGLGDSAVKNMVVMVQKEVADKFLAQPGERNYSPLAIIAQSVGKVERIVNVPPGAFYPPPKVDSSVIRFRKEKGSYNREFAQFLRQAFKNPRKTLKKNLGSLLPPEKLEEFGLSPSIRPHQVDISTFFQLFSSLK